jgi:peptidoglycan/LPS O-acetylase OafA/YrhL
VKGRTEPHVEAPERGLRYLVALDGLRGIAIILVLLHNLTMTSARTPPLLSQLFEPGWLGVQLFFVLSGYLITRNLLANELSSAVLTAFMVRRWLRIVPICYALLAVYFYVVPLIFDAPTIVAKRPLQIWYWLFLSNWTEPFGLAAPGLGHLWSLGVEVQFYLLWPLVVLLAGRKRLVRACVTIIVLGFVSATALRVAGASSMAVYKFTITRMGALAAGGLVALVAQRPGLRVPSRPLALGAGAALAAIAAWRGGFDYADAVVEIAGLPLSTLLFALWLLPIARATSSRSDPAQGTLAVRVPSTPWLRSVGRVSYGMYVLHYPIHWAVMDRIYPALLAPDGSVSTWKLGAYVAAASVVTYLLARLLWLAIERPVLSLKRYFPPTGVRRPTAALETLAARGLDRP